ncbi:MAG: NADP-dependent malic enzyme [Bacteroidetes bacterium]|nr:NADP-dependent malic enzyme [Bacteroidota bacterium]
MSVSKEEALRYHSEGRKGKIEVIATKPCFTARELALAYTPGVAEPCLEIEKDESKVYEYTAKGNLVAVVSNGTAVLGLGNIGAAAGKPVMEGKGVLFKRFADIDVFDIELNTEDPKEIIRAVQLLEPTFGGINLEDIKAPECFEIEQELIKTMNIPVFHDDQHGTAIISCAALINAAEIAGKKLEEMRLVVVGAGAAGIACSNLYITAGVKRENIAMFDTKGHIHKGRTDLNKYKEAFANEIAFYSIEEALNGADAFLGLSKGGLLKKHMVAGMANTPIIMAMANPNPEITYTDALEARSDVIMATGRSDYPNQVNNVLGFPFIFRGALDVKATAITEEMKMAAVKALADLAKEEVPDIVKRAYKGEDFSFGREYIIPKPFDPRVLWKVAPAIAKAAIDGGVARKIITDWHAYEEELKERLGFSQEIIRLMSHKAKENPKRIVYPEGENESIIRAANAVALEGIGFPVLLGRKDFIENKISELGFDYTKFEIHDLRSSSKAKKYAEKFYEKRKRKGVTLDIAEKLMHRRPNYFGSMMVETGEADALISGVSAFYPETIKPALECIGVKEGINKVSGMHVVILKGKVFFLADTSVNINPTAEEIAEIAILAADTVKEFDITPSVAMLSFSEFGSVTDEESIKMRKATVIVNNLRPDINCDGEMQADTAVDFDVLSQEYPFTKLQSRANVLIFPNLSSGNILYKLLDKLASAAVIGPIMLGMNKSVHLLQRNASVDDIINMSSIAVVDAAY